MSPLSWLSQPQLSPSIPAPRTQAARPRLAFIHQPQSSPSTYVTNTETHPIEAESNHQPQQLNCQLLHKNQAANKLHWRLLGQVAGLPANTCIACVAEAMGPSLLLLGENSNTDIFPGKISLHWLASGSDIWKELSKGGGVNKW